MIENVSRLHDILYISDFDRLIGEVENVWFDCKSQPYKIEVDAGKRELAKDVSAFANRQGGFILIGIKTKKSVTNFGDEIEEIRPFGQDLVNTKQYEDIINSWVYPQIETLKIFWLPLKSDATKGIVVIEIPEQKKNLGPFIIVKTLDGVKTVEIVFGYAERKSDTNQHLSAPELQRAIRSGFNYENQIKERLDGIETLLRHSSEPNREPASYQLSIEKIQSRITDSLSYEDLNSHRVMVLSAYPDKLKELKTLFLTANGSIHNFLEKPPTLRRMGWSLETLDQAQIMRGEMIRVTNGKRKVIDLYRDGTLVFAGLADNHFLGHASPSKETPQINSVALIELVYNFFVFYQLVILDMNEPPDMISIRVDFKNMHKDGIKTMLLPYATGSTQQIFGDNVKTAPENDMTINLTLDVKNYNAAALAYGVVKEMYINFGHEEDKIPFVKNVSGISMIDADAIKALH